MSTDINAKEVEEIEGEETLNNKCDDTIYPLKLNDIRIDKDRMSLFEIKRRCKRGDIVLDPDFQRNEVWGRKQESELIESILMGIPLPIIYLFQTKDALIQVVDGRQRITAIIKFMDNKFGLTELKIMKDIVGNKFCDLEPI